jgi:hypothetical protein
MIMMMGMIKRRGYLLYYFLTGKQESMKNGEIEKSNGLTSEIGCLLQVFPAFMPSC